MTKTADAMAVLARIDHTRASLLELVRLTDTGALAELPPSGEWSVVENVRHLLFAEQLHLGRFLPDGRKWSAVGLAPHFLANEEAFSEVGREPTEDIEEVLEAWEAVHVPIRELASEATEETRRALQGNLDHVVFHLRIIESLLGQSARNST